MFAIIRIFIIVVLLYIIFMVQQTGSLEGGNHE
jgi:hypothetical protein